MTHSYETWLIHMRHDSLIWDMTHSYVIWLIYMRHDSFIWDMTHSYETWLIHMWHDSIICDMPHSYMTWHIHTWHDGVFSQSYGVASISRLLKIISLFCKKALWKRLYSAEETYNFKEPTNGSHPIPLIHTCHDCIFSQYTHRICQRYVTWHIHMWHDSLRDMTQSFVTWLRVVAAKTRIEFAEMETSRNSHDPFTLLTRMQHDMTHSHEWHGFCVCVKLKCVCVT